MGIVGQHLFNIYINPEYMIYKANGCIDIAFGMFEYTPPVGPSILKESTEGGADSCTGSHMYQYVV
jgi:hypothetical protein